MPDSFRETYPGPWRIVEHEESIAVMCKDTVLAFIYFEDEPIRRRLMNRVTRAEALALARAIVGLSDRPPETT